MIAYLIGEPDMGWAVRFLDLLRCTIFLVLEQEDNSMDWFRQNGKCIIVDAKNLLDPEVANTDVFENCSEEGLSFVSGKIMPRAKGTTNRLRLNLTPTRP